MKFTFKSSMDSTELYPPLSFPVKVSGKELMASIVAINDHPIHDQYRIKFSDGYVDTFTLCEGHIEGGKLHESAKYSEAIKEDMDMLFFLSPELDIWLLRFPIDGETSNVWVRKAITDEQIKFTVYSKGDYHFDVMKENGKWLFRTVRVIDPREIDLKLANEVVKILAVEGVPA